MCIRDRNGLVLVAVSADLGFLIQGSRVCDGENIVGVHVIELDIKGITVCGRSVELVISAFYQNVLAALNGNAARIEGQTFVHLIVHDVVLRLAINSIDRNIELYSIADRCIISRRV